MLVIKVESNLENMSVVNLLRPRILQDGSVKHTSYEYVESRVRATEENWLKLNSYIEEHKSLGKYESEAYFKSLGWK